MLKQIWFYDNDVRNASDPSNKSIRFIKIPEIGNNEKLAEMSWDHYKNWYNKENGDYPDYDGISDYFFSVVSEDPKGVNAIMKMEQYDSKSGIQEEHVTELMQNVDKGLVSAVVFDWDRTLTKIEGIYTPLPEEFNTIMDYLTHLEERGDSRFRGITNLGEKGFIDYLFHNNTDETAEEIGKRSNLIGNMIKKLQDENIPTFILTNNGTARKPKGTKLFKLIIDGLLEPGKIDFKIEHIVYNYIGKKEIMIKNDIMDLIEKMRLEAEPEPEPEEYKAEPGGANNNNNTANANNLARHAATLGTETESTLTPTPTPTPRPRRKPVPRPRSERSLDLDPVEGGSRKLKRKSKRLSKNNKKSKKLYKNSKKSKRLSKNNKKSKKLYKNSKKSKRLSKNNKRRTKKL